MIQLTIGKKSVELLNSMNKAKVGLSLSMINNNIDTQSDAIQKYYEFILG